MTARRPRASLYARLSVAADEENLSLDGMVRDMRDLCDRLGFEEVALHVDDGKSGGRRDRDEFQDWLEDARRGRCDVLVNPVTDRLTREGLNVAASILDVVEGKDPATGKPAHKPVRLVDTTGLDSAHGDAFRFRFVIQAEVGRAERERIRERSRKRARNLRRAGRWGGGTPPFGYKAVPNPNGPGWALDVEPDEAKHIREAAEALLKPEPDPLTRIARRWNHAGIRPRRAASWSRVTLGKVLTGEAVMGRVQVDGRPLRNEDGQILQPWPAILSVAEVTAIRQVLAPNPDAPYSGGRRPARLLSGLLTCAGCRSSLVVFRRKARSKSPDPYIGYRCPDRGQGGTCPLSVTVTAAPVEAFVEGLYLRTAGHLPYYVERTVVSGVEELAAVEADIRETLADMATAADADTFARLQHLQARREELSALEPDSRTELIPTGRTMAEHWAEAMIDDRREILADAFDLLEIRPGRRGPKGFDPARLNYQWREDVDSGEEEW